jgi:hypothetical protein
MHDQLLRPVGIKETWQDLGAFMDWSNKAKKVSTQHSGTLIQALW